MSVIYGIIHSKEKRLEKTEAGILRKSLDYVRFDREGIWQEENAHLGVLLRQLVQNDAEQAPLYDPISGLTICADARLDNRDELAEKLEISQEKRLNVPDSLLILRAYQKWGVNSPEQLLGDFAYAIYEKNSGRLFCARDHLGIRPFYYYWIDGTFCFCTLHPPLMAACPVAPTPNDVYIVASFIRSYTELTDTVANEINQLPPAHSLSIDATGLKVHRYWAPESNTVLQLAGEAEYAQAMREVFTQAVACRTRTDRRVGTHLSSGLDSGSITVLAARELRKEGKSPLAFSWSPEPEHTTKKLGDERDLIRDVCRQEELECHFLDQTPEDAYRILQEAMSSWGDNLWFHEIKHLHTALRENCRIMLSGWGGDELTSFNGDRVYLADLLRREGFLRLLSEMFRLRMNRHGSFRSMAKEILYPFIPDSIYYRFFNLPIRRNSESLISSRFAKDLLIGSRKRDRWQQRDIKKLQIQWLNAGYFNQRIERWAELGERYGVNYLYPVFDKRVVEFMLSLPNEQLCKKGWRRFLFRRAMEGILPPSVQWNRSKAEMAYGEHANAVCSVYFEKFQQNIQEAMNLPSFQRYFKPEAVEKMLASSNTTLKLVILNRVHAYVKFLDQSFSR